MIFSRKIEFIKNVGEGLALPRRNFLNKTVAKGEPKWNKNIY